MAVEQNDLKVKIEAYTENLRTDRPLVGDNGSSIRKFSIREHSG
jgi:hypothetical protein